ncbi:hypothetical protein [Pseudalkalibacillus caeni]|uniref:Uncharacterized protein n=1 Tax=Exobacillus caeni TaxID=2574798 RepID=A0A5R9F3M9_9BACL|nr:hypothetical protein [Pseudalkalibacillus caeni]TLS38207.1 hypothetical protein FCL54_06630 [Pseudalkalibacillus caeni]
MNTYAETLEEVVQFAKEAKQNGEQGTLYLHQRESSPEGTVLSDEDTGTNLQQQVKLVLETSNGHIFYAGDFEEERFYKMALEQIDHIKEYYPIEEATEESIEKKANHK